jgi:dUTP pyrophosphatase
MQVKFKRLHEDAVLPMRATELSAGFDVTVVKIEHLGDNKVYCKLGFAAQPPIGYKLEISPRSSFTKYNWVMNNSPGQGDADYPGEYEVRFTAIPVNFMTRSYKDAQGIDRTKQILTYEEFPYKVGDRIAQMCLSKVEETEWIEVDEFDDYQSGRDGGFGSTGK